MTLNDELRQEVAAELGDRLAWIFSDECQGDAAAVLAVERAMRRALGLGMGPTRGEVFRALAVRIVADVRRIQKQVEQRITRQYMLEKSRQMRTNV